MTTCTRLSSTWLKWLGAAMFSAACSHARDLDTIRTRQLSDGAGGSDRRGQSAIAGASFAMTLNEPGTAGVSGGIGDAGAALARGLPMLAVTMGDFTHYDEHDRSLAPELIEVVGQPFALAQRFPLGSGDGEPGSAGYFGPIRNAIARGDLLRASFWARCAVPGTGINYCRTALVFEEVADPYLNGGLEQKVQVGQDWMPFHLAFMSVHAQRPGDAQLTFRLGYPDQVLEIGAIALQDYGNALTLAQLEALNNRPFTEVVTASSLSNYGPAVRDIVGGAKYPFGQATRFSTLGQTYEVPEQSGYQGRNSASVQRHDLLLVTFWARCVESHEPDASCHSSVVFEEGNSPYTNAGLATPTLRVGPMWQEYYFPFRSLGDYATDRVKLGLRLGYADQTIEYGPIALRRYESPLQIGDLPQSSFE